MGGFIMIGSYDPFQPNPPELSDRKAVVFCAGESRVRSSDEEDEGGAAAGDHNVSSHMELQSGEGMRKSLSRVEITTFVGPEADNLSKNVEIEKIKRLMDVAVTSAASRSGSS